MNFPKWLARYAAVLWTVGIFVATLVPLEDVPEPATALPIDKLVHFVLFAGFGVFWMRALYTRFQRRLLWVIVAGVVIAVGTELLQGMMPYGRTPDGGDIIANILGLLTAVWAYRLWFRTYRQAA